MSSHVRSIASTIVCAGCGTEAAAVPDRSGTGYPFQCSAARRDDDIDHVLTRELDPASVQFPKAQDTNPFVTYRHLFHAWQVARAFGMSDGDYVALVRALDDEVARADGHGFTTTPFAPHVVLSDRIGITGGVWVKDETDNVSGSHKARHLMGIMIYLKVLEALVLAASSVPLAIASCGNAALAAAVVARAARRRLDVFIPVDAPASVVVRLGNLGANTIVCQRSDNTPGDPCFLQFSDAVRRGALPFCCQGSVNGLTIEGGKTLGWEMVSALGSIPLDAVVIQVGGGALASAVIQAFFEAAMLGACARIPRFYTVQTQGAFPLQRAYTTLTARIAAAVASDRLPIADALSARDFDSPLVQRELQHAATHRREFMWPWETEPRSIARGILDDETYDWLAVVRGMLRSGGRPVVVSDATLAAAHDLARETTGISVDHTGTAGLAGLLQLMREGAIEPSEKVAVIFSGRER
jgi:threonine synthase